MSDREGAAAAPSILRGVAWRGVACRVCLSPALQQQSPSAEPTISLMFFSHSKNIIGCVSFVLTIFRASLKAANVTNYRSRVEVGRCPVTLDLYRLLPRKRIVNALIFRLCANPSAAGGAGRGRAGQGRAGPIHPRGREDGSPCPAPSAQRPATLLEKAVRKQTLLKEYFV